jgi:hypothetical protein
VINCHNLHGDQGREQVLFSIIQIYLFSNTTIVTDDTTNVIQVRGSIAVTAHEIGRNPNQES